MSAADSRGDGQTAAQPRTCLILTCAGGHQERHSPRGMTFDEATKVPGLLVGSAMLGRCGICCSKLSVGIAEEVEEERVLEG